MRARVLHPIADPNAVFFLLFVKVSREPHARLSRKASRDPIGHGIATENPMQVTEAPVSTRPRTGMPSRVSWPVMGGPTAHPTGVTLASGDPHTTLGNSESFTLDYN